MTFKAGYLPGHELNGKLFADTRSVSMTTTIPPANYRWTSQHAADYQNTPPTDTAEHEVWKSIRLAFLDPYELSVTEEGKYRVWRWLDGTSEGPGAFQGRLVVWWERRPINDPEPLTPGLWPSDN